MESQNRGATPSLLPILRSRQQGEVLAAVLGEPNEEFSIAALSQRLKVPYASVHREVERGERAGILLSRRLGNVRLIRANRASPYFDGLAAVLVRAFGPPTVIGSGLARVPGIDEAYIFGSWASRFEGVDGDRPVGDIDLLVLGEPERSALYEVTSQAAERLGREIQVTIREAGWLASGAGTFHDTVVSRPMVPVASG